MLKYLLKYFSVFIILITLSSVAGAFLPGKMSQAYDYLVYICFGSTCFLYYKKNYRKINDEHRLFSNLYKYLIVYLIISFGKQWFVPSGLFPFFRLNIAMSLLGFGAMFIFMYEKEMILKVIRLWWKYVPIIFVLTFWKLELSSYIQVLYFVTLFLLLLPLFNHKRKLTIIISVLFIMAFGMQQRIDFINIGMPLLLLVIVTFIKVFSKQNFKFLFYALMFVPVFFTSAFFINGFNVLNLDQYIDDETNLSAEKLNEDTRSFLYEEAWISGIYNNALIQGRTPFYGYDSSFADNRDGDALIVQGRNSQRISEVFIVNILTWFGIIGVLVFFLVFLYAGGMALKRTRNLYLAVFAVYIAFFWVESWIGHIIFAPSTSYTLLYMVIAMCHNPRLQAMGDKEMKAYLGKLLNA